MAANMTNENDPELREGDGEGDLTRRLLIRVAVAGVAIVALLGGLALLDNLNAPPPAEQIAVVPPVVETHPPPATAPVEEKAQEPMAATVAEEQPQVPAAEPELSAAPTSSGTPKAEHVERPERPLTKPAEARLAMLQPSQPAMVMKQAGPAGELARAAHAGASAARPQAHGVFLLQLGVFTSTANAEELRAKLELNGFPTQIEARVHVGPFASRLEAEQARDKLKRLGIEPGVTVTKK